MTDQAGVSFGFRHRAAAGTMISSNGNGVVVTPGKVGEIDFSIETGEVQGIIPVFDMDPAALDDGAGVQSTTLGIAESGEQIVTGRLGIPKRGSWLTVTPDFREVGATATNSFSSARARSYGARRDSRARRAESVP